MKSPRPSRRHLESLCAEVHADDGADPKLFFRPTSHGRQPHRKTLQLCQQVADTLNYLFGGELSDDVLQCLQVESVVPAPDASQLLVTMVSVVALDEPLDPRDVTARLDRATPLIRREVARAITRKRAPQLVFHFHAGPAHREVSP
jgi:ribosome-binding factor A